MFVCSTWVGTPARSSIGMLLALFIEVDVVVAKIGVCRACASASLIRAPGRWYGLPLWRHCGEGCSSEAYRVLYRKKRLEYASGSRLLLSQKAEKLGKKVSMDGIGVEAIKKGRSQCHRTSITRGYLVALESGNCRGERPLKRCLSCGLGQKKNISICGLLALCGWRRLNAYRKA
jgi:hypothetical protein